MTIKVLKKHIQLGMRKAVSNNPVALALRDATGQLWMVGTNDATTFDGDQIMLPHEVIGKIQRYDAGFGMEPFNFEAPVKSYNHPKEESD